MQVNDQGHWQHIMS